MAVLFGSVKRDSRQDAEAAVRLAMSRGYDLETQHLNETLLMAATGVDAVGTARCLLSLGADPNTQVGRQRSAH